MAGIADEACVLDVRDGLDTHEEIVHVHAVHRPFVFLGIFGTHQELASRNQRELGQQIGRHRYRQEDSACAFSTTLAGMQLETFALERYQSIWENRVTWNLAESGVHPLRVTDLVNTPELQVAMFEQELGYPQTNGTIEPDDSETSEEETQRHRILRRGIPFGGSFGAPKGGSAKEPRGLLFFCYQTTIENQFEFIQSQWLNRGNAFTLGEEANLLAAEFEVNASHGPDPANSYQNWLARQERRAVQG